MVVVLGAEQLEDIARTALATGGEEEALLRLVPLVAKSDDARLWQFTGLLHRSLDQHADALRCFMEGSRLAPDDPGIAHGLARVTLESGMDAVKTFERALQIAPTSGEVLLGLVAAKFATGRGIEAERQLDAALQRSPLWVDGHMQLAQLRSMLGMRDQAQASIKRALIGHPAAPSLWEALLNLALSAENFAALNETVALARQAGMPQDLVLPFEAIAAAEQGEATRADALFHRIPPPLLDTIGTWYVRHLLRTGRGNQAVAAIDHELDGPRAAQFWPYASIAWRLVGDPRSYWLERDGQFVAEFDLNDRLPPSDRLATLLRSFHVAKGEYLDQSVRGGTQTDGPLLSRIELEMRQLRAAIVGAVEQYVGLLPPFDPRHPLLRESRDRRIRFAGSWSVRLRDSGYHANHVHPQGWISSALYIVVPERRDGDAPDAGWLKIGEAPHELGLDLPALRLIEPKAGHLVLFPSWMWHGTVPFTDGERLTVAFDIQPPT